MSIYKIEYITDTKQIKKEGLTEKEVKAFISDLKKENYSSLKIQRIVEKEEER